MQLQPVWVLDTNILLDWLIFSDQHAAPLVKWIESGRVKLATRQDCRDEFIRVLDYPALKASLTQREQALHSYDLWHVQVDALFNEKTWALQLPLCSDADDQKFMELALEAKAQWLITKDKALLKLAKVVQKLECFEILDVTQATRQLAIQAGDF